MMYQSDRIGKSASAALLRNSWRDSEPRRSASTRNGGHAHGSRALLICLLYQFRMIIITEQSNGRNKSILSVARESEGRRRLVCERGRVNGPGAHRYDGVRTLLNLLTVAWQWQRKANAAESAGAGDRRAALERSSARGRSLARRSSLSPHLSLPLRLFSLPSIRLLHPDYPAYRPYRRSRGASWPHATTNPTADHGQLRA